MIQIGEKIPAVTVFEYVNEETEGCSIGPNPVDTAKAAEGKTIAVLALPGAFTPTCSAKHLPGFIQHAEAFKAKGVDEIWCISVNDAFVMEAWGKAVGASGKVRMLADGAALYTQAIGMGLDLTARGLGLRSQRYSMLIKNGVVSQVNLDQPGQFEQSTAEVLLAQLG